MAKTTKKEKPKSTPAKGKAKKASAVEQKKPVTARTVVAEIVDDDEKENSLAPVVDHDQDHDIDSHADVSVDSKAIAPTDPVALYLQEIRKYPLLTREQEEELAKKYYETKDPKMAQALVTANLRFVVKVAADYSRFGARMIDLIQEGNMGLMHAVREFNPYKGVRLITYAVWWIRGYIQEYLMKQYSLVKIGTTQNQKKLFYQLQKERQALEQIGEGHNLQLLSSRLGIPEDEVKTMAQRMSGRDVSLDRPIDDKGNSPMSLLDMQKDEHETPDVELEKREEISHLTEAIEKLKPTLSAREKIILDERILADDPLTLQEIGEKHGITREAVRQMEARLMKKIKEQFQK